MLSFCAVSAHVITWQPLISNCANTKIKHLITPDGSLTTISLFLQISPAEYSTQKGERVRVTSNILLSARMPYCIVLTAPDRDCRGWRPPMCLQHSAAVSSGAELTSVSFGRGLRSTVGTAQTNSTRNTSARAGLRHFCPSSQSSWDQAWRLVLVQSALSCAAQDKPVSVMSCVAKQ